MRKEFAISQNQIIVISPTIHLMFMPKKKGPRHGQLRVFTVQPTKVLQTYNIHHLSVVDHLKVKHLSISSNSDLWGVFCIKIRITVANKGKFSQQLQQGYCLANLIHNNKTQQNHEKTNQCHFRRKSKEEKKKTFSHGLMVTC